MSLLPVLLVAGFAPAPFARAIDAYLGVDLAPGNEMRVAAVFAASPAEKAGLRRYDVIVAVDGKKVQTLGELETLLRRKRPGHTMAVAVRRNNAEQTMRLTLGQRSRAPYLGISLIRVEALTINVVADKSPASTAGLQVNDVVLNIDDAKFSNTTELAAFLQKKKIGDVVTVAVRRANQQRQVKVKLGTRPGY